MSSFFKKISSDTNQENSPENPQIPLKPKKRIALFLALAGLVILVPALGFAYWHSKQKDVPVVIIATPGATSAPSAPATPAPTPTPALATSLLTGLMVPAGTENLHPLGVMIENTPDARPQYGLGQADLVYEAIAEGGITRFYAIFADPTKAVRVEPVRSARPYYVDLSNEVKAFFAHAGGSQDGLSEIKKTGAYDLDGLVLGSLFHRDTTRKVSSEHTLYSSTDQLWQYATGTKGWPKTADFAPWLFQDDIAVASRPASEAPVKVSVTSASFAVQWTYDPTTNSYKRVMAGVAHTDAGTGAQITAKNVILQTAVRTNDTERYGSIVKPISRYALTGTGAAVIIQNGQAVKGTWKKAASDQRTHFYDAAGAEVKFVRGNTWIQLVESNSTISY